MWPWPAIITNGYVDRDEDMWMMNNRVCVIALHSQRNSVTKDADLDWRPPGGNATKEMACR